ncbi:hypothetical protein GLOTRDRAFT_113107 [Gloeophyllum trabeum ATCC 11539]|uniref:Uncharacterized protein n=1 Tax=Gloeophyllum trabeum (strain ATCC 11539 / FP-39264 / Madison 617) TaxID=670483 RepID=S7S3U9_GLOTA|nr:uncharacterized protein GLOTRDRAFT_113107 [Gloeophyllum trabeum ATCC 11539]EPQ60489.1 hypothetical protein GLOTRDRAFT_113107 [Gloeophyllum trabeum ATCC 11539]
MATRRRIGVSIATSEAARRQLMAPVPCWERVWTKPDNAPPGSTLKVYKWVKTDKVQQFSDDESEVDAPLAPLPDEPEVVEGDEEGEQEETAPPPSVPPEAPPAHATAASGQEDESAAKSPKTQNTLSLEVPSSAPAAEANDILDDSLKPLVDDMNATADISVQMTTENAEGLDLSQLPPDGTSFEAAQDMSQLQDADALLGGQMMDQSADPFGEQMQS